MGFTSPTPNQLLTEGCTFWAFAFVLFIGRIWARAISNGSFKRLQIDDYVMMVTFIFYTGLITLINISAHYNTNLFPPDQLESIMVNPADVQNRILGSKIVIGLEICMMASTWGVKCCLLILYYKITQNLQEQKYVKAIAVYVIIGYITIEVCYFAVWCRPFSGYWAMPVPNPQCATYVHYDYMQAVFNISSDAMMLAVPIPLIWRAQVPPFRKAVLLAVFSLGVFVIIAAILNKYNNLASPWTTTYQLWYMREASVSIYVANIMCWWPLIRKIFGVKAFNARTTAANTPDPSSFHLGSTGPSSHIAKLRARMKVSRLSTLGTTRSGLTTSGSEEAINSPDHRTENSVHDVPLEIWQKVEYDVERRPATSSDADTKPYDHVNHGATTYNATAEVNRFRDDEEKLHAR